MFIKCIIIYNKVNMFLICDKPGTLCGFYRKSYFTITSVRMESVCVITLVEVTSELMIGTAFHNFSHVLSLLVDGHGSYHAAVRGCRGELDLNRAGLSNLTVELLE